jgi:UDP-3-O-[3-hydroxymyristoyl] glucosamine N-acyltransferase
MKFLLKEIAQLVDAQIEGSPDKWIDTLSKIEEAQAHSLSFLANPIYEPHLYKSKATAIIVKNDFVPRQAHTAVLLRVADPYLAFTKLLEHYQKLSSTQLVGVMQPTHIGKHTHTSEGLYLGVFANIGDGCTIGQNVKIYPNVSIGNNVKIGDNTILYAGVRIYDGCQIGQNCVIHANAVVGADGFGFAPQPDGSYRAIPQLGNVIIEDDVSVGANTTIDRATLGSTIIRKGVKLDNLIQIAHNVEIGQNTVMAAQVGVAGSTKIGDNCMVGGQAGFINHLHIANRTTVLPKSAVHNSIKQEGTSIWGRPAFDKVAFMKAQAIFRKLPELDKKIAEIIKKIGGL